MAFYTNYPVYPTEVLDTTDYPDQADDVDYVYDHLVNALRDEVIAIQAELGTVPKAAFADVKARLTAAESPSKIQDADADTLWDTEETVDKDEIQGKVKGVEFFRGHDDGIITLAKQSGAMAYPSAQTTVPHETMTKVALNMENFDVQGEFDNVTNYRFTAKKAGKYLIIGYVRWTAGVLVNKSYQCTVRKNGVDYFMGVALPAAGGSMTNYAMIVAALSANDYLELYAYHNSGVNELIATGVSGAFLSVLKVA